MTQNIDRCTLLRRACHRWKVSVVGTGYVNMLEDEDEEECREAKLSNWRFSVRDLHTRQSRSILWVSFRPSRCPVW